MTPNEWFHRLNERMTRFGLFTIHVKGTKFEGSNSNYKSELYVVSYGWHLYPNSVHTSNFCENFDQIYDHQVYS